MTRRISYIVLALCLCLPAIVLAGDWPQWRGPTVDGISPETGINKDWGQKLPTIRWKIPLSDNGFAGPSVADGKVFIIDHQGKQDIVRAVDLLTGADVWTYRYDDASDDNYGFSRATPVYDQGKIYTMSRLGWANCLDARSGAKIWARNIITDFNGQRPQWDMAMSPLIDGDKEILCPGGKNAAVVALNKNTGETIWQGGGSDKPAYSTPVAATIFDVKQYVVFTAAGIVGVKADDGTKLWSYSWETSYGINAATPIVLNGDSVFITSGYARGCTLLQVSKDGVTKRWQTKEMQSHFSSPILYNGNIYGTTDPGDLVCLNPSTGKAIWRQPGFEKGGVVVVDNTLLALTGNSGDLVMVKLTPDGYHELGRCKPLGGQSWTAPIVADGKLIVRNKTTLACLDLK